MKKRAGRSRWPEILAGGVVLIFAAYAVRDLGAGFWGHDLVADWTAILALATFAAVAISVAQIRYVARADATGQSVARLQLRSAADERDKTARSLRAYVSIAPGDLTLDIGTIVEPDESPRPTVHVRSGILFRSKIVIENKGIVPAGNVYVFGRIRVTEDAAENPIPAMSAGQEIGDLIRDSPAVHLIAHSSEDILKSFVYQKGGVVVEGNVKYEDGFGIVRTELFQFIYLIITMPNKAPAVILASEALRTPMNAAVEFQ